MNTLCMFGLNQVCIGFLIIIFGWEINVYNLSIFYLLILKMIMLPKA